MPSVCVYLLHTNDVEIHSPLHLHLSVRDILLLSKSQWGQFCLFVIVCLFVCMFVCLFVYLLVRLFVCLFVCLRV